MFPHSKAFDSRTGIESTKTQIIESLNKDWSNHIEKQTPCTQAIMNVSVKSLKEFTKTFLSTMTVTTIHR